MGDITIANGTLEASTIQGTLLEEGKKFSVSLADLLKKNYLLTEEFRHILIFGSGADQITIYPKDAESFWVELGKLIPLSQIIKGLSCALYQIEH